MDPSESHSLAPSSSDHPIEGILKLLIVVKDTAGGHSDRLGSRFLDAAHRHAEMLRLDHNHDTLGSQMFHESIRDLVGYALRGQGYGMEGFGCADDFYKGMKKAVPDLVLLDVMLPGEDGLSILKKIREREANIPIIMMTAKSSEFEWFAGLISVQMIM